MQTNVIKLNGKPSPTGSLLKRCALVTFKGLRAVTNQVQQLPDVLTQSVTDLRDAWEESSRPNA